MKQFGYRSMQKQQNAKNGNGMEEKMKQKNETGKKKGKTKKNDFFFVCKHIRFSWGLIILALVIGSVQSIVTSMVPDATANLFDGDFSTGKLLGVAQTLAISLVLGLVSYVFRVFAESKSVLAARTSVWERMINAKMEYYDANDPASRLSMVTVDAQTFGAGLVQLFVYIPTMVVLLLSCVVQLLGYSSKLLMILWLLVPMHLIYIFFVGRWQQRLGKDLAWQIGDLTGYLAERIRNLPMIKSFAAEEKEDKNGVEAAGKLFQVYKRYNVYLQAVIHSYQSLTAMISTVVSVLWGAYLLKTGQTDITSFLAFSMYVASINATFLVISIVWGFVKDFQGRANRLARLIEAPAETTGKMDSGKVDIPDGDICAEKVEFRYQENDKPVLKDISFVIPRGKVTAIVGPSGSGKTTLIKLLERLYSPTGGRITIGDVDIEETNIESWRRKLSYVVQDAGVFSGTLRQAFCYSVEREVSEEELIRVAEKIDLYDYIRTLPDGFDTLLANWGSSLSGGQRQRIAIARAMLRSSDILIFDEPTSALDPETANAICRIIFEEFQGKTVIIISHELHYVAQADKIVVVNQGRMEGSGSHDELMQACRVYHDLVQEQSYKEVFSV